MLGAAVTGGGAWARAISGEDARDRAAGAADSRDLWCDHQAVPAPNDASTTIAATPLAAPTSAALLPTVAAATPFEVAADAAFATGAASAAPALAAIARRTRRMSRSLGESASRTT